MKKHALIALACAGLLALTGCGTKLTTSKPTYKNTGMVAVIKGQAKGKTVTYTAPTKRGTAKVANGQYVFTLPMTTTAQTVTIKASGEKVTAKVKAAKAIGTYATVAASYNQALVYTALPQKTLAAMKAAQAKAPTQAEIAAMTPAQQQALVKQQAAFKQALATAKTATAGQQLPATSEGLTQLLKTSSGTIRANVQDGQLIALTQIAPLKVLKDKTAKNQFGVEFGLLATALGADAQKVGKEFQQAMKDQDGSSTTIKTIVSNGVKFDVGYSASDLFIYMTK